MFLVAFERGSCAVVDNSRFGIFTFCRTTRQTHLTSPILIPKSARCDADAEIGVRELAREVCESRLTASGIVTTRATSSRPSITDSLCSCLELQFPSHRHGLQRPRPGPSRRPRPMGFIAASKSILLRPASHQRYPVFPAAFAGVPVSRRR
jgi:hypothetical protein